MMSMSWMLCSSRAPAPARATSPRQVDLYMPCSGMYWSSRNITLMTRPLAGSAIRVRNQQKAGEKRRTSPTWLTTPARRDDLGHGRGPGQIGGQGLLTEDGQPRAAAMSTRRACSEVQRADEDGVAAGQDLVLVVAHGGPGRGGEGLGPGPVGVVDAGPGHHVTGAQQRARGRWR